MNENEKVIENLQRRFEIASKFKRTEFYLKAEGEYLIELCQFEDLGLIANKIVSKKIVSLQVFAHYVTLSRMTLQTEAIKFEDINNENIEDKLEIDTPLMPEDKDLERVVRKQILDNLANFMKEYLERKTENRPWPTPEQDMESERDEIELHDLYTFHTAIIKCIREIKKSSGFDSNDSILSIGGKKIVISGSKNSNPHRLLKTLYGKKKKLWNYDEIAKSWGWREDEYTKQSWRTFYNACRSVNSIIEKKTGIQDFIKYDSKTAQINTKYL